jgi:hypothetical protein
MRGTLVIEVRTTRRQRLIRRIIKRNVITFDAGDIIRALVAQRATDPTPASFRMGSMRFGTNNTPPQRSDTNLIGEVVSIRKALPDIQKIDGLSGEISFTATLASGDGNGNTFQEAGLFTFGSALFDANVGGNLKCFARQVHAPLAKTSGVVFDYTWTLQFTT